MSSSLISLPWMLFGEQYNDVYYMPFIIHDIKSAKGRQAWSQGFMLRRVAATGVCVCMLLLFPKMYACLYACLLVSLPACL